MTQHKWHKEIKAWADGAEIEYRAINLPDDAWSVDPDPSWGFGNYEFRIKPQPKEPKYLYAFKVTRASGRMVVDEITLWTEKAPVPGYIGKIKLEEE